MISNHLFHDTIVPVYLYWMLKGISECILICKSTVDLFFMWYHNFCNYFRNGDLAVSFVNKYLTRKLNLKHESEVMLYSYMLIHINNIFIASKQ